MKTLGRHGRGGITHHSAPEHARRDLVSHGSGDHAGMVPPGLWPFAVHAYEAGVAGGQLVLQAKGGDGLSELFGVIHARCGLLEITIL